MSADPFPPASGGRTSEEVRRALAERIVSGHLRPGQRLGAERALAAELGVSVQTVSTYRARVLEKMRLESNTDLTQYALHHRLIG